MQAATSWLTLLIAERASRLCQKRQLAPGRELELWLEAEAQVKREIREAKASQRARTPPPDGRNHASG
jgi:hypothetical protein